MIGGISIYSEVFDSVTRNFMYIKTLPKWVRIPEPNYFERLDKLYQVINIGYTIYFFRDEGNKVDVYSHDMRNNFFISKTSMIKAFFNFNEISCIKVPMT